MTRFTMDNTEGYAPADLRELNARFDAEISRVYLTTTDATNIAAKSLRDAVAERVLAAFDAEMAP